MLDTGEFLSAREHEYFVHAVEASLRVQARHQFFVWVQHALCGLLPHKLLVCACKTEQGTYHLERFSDFPVSEAHWDDLCAPAGGMVFRMIDHWRDGGGAPNLACPEMNGRGCYDDFKADLQRLELPNAAGHGTFDLRGRAESYFAFGALTAPLGPRHAHVLQLLVPHLHMTLLRVLRGQAAGQARAIEPAHVLTEREVEILRWVQHGKSNADIGHVLNISPLTVKNHVQNILRKLKVQNRAQAVAFAMSHQIIRSSLPTATSHLA